MAAVASPDKSEMSVVSQSPTTNPVLITCPVCQEDYEEPKLLPCAHRLCRKCLVEWISSNAGPPACPVCHRSIKDKKVSTQTKDSKEASRVEGGSKLVQQMDKAGDTSNSSHTKAARWKSKTGVGKPAADAKSYTVDAAGSVSMLPNSVTMTEVISNKAMVDGTISKRPLKTDPSNSIVRTTEQITDLAATAQISLGTALKTEPLSNTNGAFKIDNFAMQKKEASNANAKAHNLATLKDNAVIALVDSLPTDVVLLAVMESTKKLRPPHVCSICQGDKVAFDLCMFCEEKLCQLCSLHHARMAITRHHEVQPIDKLTPTQLSRNRRERCAQHPDQFLDLYCPVHFQPTCFSCYPVRHGGCGAIETAADAATRQRQVVQKQMDKLTQASEDIRRYQQGVTENQQKARKDIIALVDRMSTALREFEDNLLDKVNRVSPTDGLQGTEVEEWNWLATAHQQLVTDTFASASNVNMLHLSGPLAARAARLATEAPKPLSGKPVRLVVKEEEVMAVEEKLKALAAVDILATQDETMDNCIAQPLFASQQTQGTAAAAQACSDATAVFDPIMDHLQPKGNYYCINTTGCIMALCMVDDNCLLIVDSENQLQIFRNDDIDRNQKVPRLSEMCRAITVLCDGLVAMTTEINVICFVDVDKNPMQLKQIRTDKGYWGIAPGTNSTLIVSYDGTPPSIDVISRKGQFLKSVVTAETFDIGRPRHLCRWLDSLIVIDIQNQRLLKIDCDTDTTHGYGFSWMHHSHMREVRHITTDKAGRLYINSTENIIVTDVAGRWRVHKVCQNYGDCAVSGEGTLFVVSGCVGEVLTKYNFTTDDS